MIPIEVEINKVITVDVHLDELKEAMLSQNTLNKINMIAALVNDIEENDKAIEESHRTMILKYLNRMVNKFNNPNK